MRLNALTEGANTEPRESEFQIELGCGTKEYRKELICANGTESWN